MAVLSHFTVQRPYGVLHGVARGVQTKALARLRADDPIWEKAKHQGTWKVFSDKYRCQPSMRLIIWIEN